MLCYRCGSHVPDGTETCGTCGQRFALGLKPGPIAGFGTGTRRHRIAVETAPYKVGEVIAGRFEIRENVGAGPVGWVFKCVDRDLDVDVAVKVLSPRLLQQAEERRQVVAELRNVRRLSHPNVVRVYEDGTDGDRLFFTMQHLEGLALRRVWDLRRQKGQLFTLKEAEQIVVQVAAGLDAALEVSAHGDLKPDNLIILPDILKITDFGLANALPRAPFMAAQKAGGVHRYVAPEFLQGERVGPRCDVFSLAVIVGEMLSGAPFEGQGFDLLARNPTLPKAIDAVFRKATSLEADHRYATAGEFAAAFLEAAGSGSARTVQNFASVAAVPQSTPPAVRPVNPAPPPPPPVSVPPPVRPVEPPAAPTLVAAMPARVENVEQTGTMSPAIRVRTADAPRETTEEVEDDLVEEEETIAQERTVLAAPGTAGMEEVTDPGQSADDEDDDKTAFGAPSEAPRAPGRSDDRGGRKSKRDKKKKDRDQKAAAPPPAPKQEPAKQEPPKADASKAAEATRVEARKSETPRPSEPPKAPARADARPDSRPDVKKVDTGKKPEVKLANKPAAPPPQSSGSNVPVIVALVLLVAIGLFLVLWDDPAKKTAADAGTTVATTEAVVSSDGTAELVDADAPVDAGPAAVVDAGAVAVAAATPTPVTTEPAKTVDAGTPALSKAEQRAEAKRKAEEEAKAKAEAKKAAEEEAKRLAEEKAAQKAALAKLDEERRAAERAAATEKLEAAARAEADRKAALKAEAERKAAEAAAKADAEKKAKEAAAAEAAAKLEAEKKAKEEAAKLAAATPAGTTCPKGMVYIKPGTFTFGAPDSDDLKNVTDWDADSVELDGFCVDPFEGPNKKGIKPSTGFTWKQAADACRASGKRLCTEEEWERACKGGGSLRFPYGKTFDAEACNTQDGDGEKRDLGLAGAFPKCVSGFGIVDMSGNAAEWTASDFEEGEADKVVKGGSSERPPFDVRCAARVRKGPGTRDKSIGYRCCADAK